MLRTGMKGQKQVVYSADNQVPLNLTITTRASDPMFVKASSMSPRASSALNEPDPVPMRGKATDLNCLLSTMRIALWTDIVIEFLLARHNMLIPAT